MSAEMPAPAPRHAAPAATAHAPMRVTLHVWRQKNRDDAGRMVAYPGVEVSPDMSFLEMLDVLNEQLIARGEDPIAFDSDCREGICGACSLTVDGIPHGPRRGTTVCQLHMRTYSDGAEIVIEPWRARAFPVLKDLVVDRSAFDRIIAAGGFVSVRTGGCPDGNAIPVPKQEADAAMDAAACIGCGACVAACPNAAAMLFAGAKISHLRHLPQGRAEQSRRALALVRQMDAEGFGNCTNYYECEAVCPKEIPVKVIAEMNRDFAKASLGSDERASSAGGS
jgi:succinate dehydrogenase / fumarate reductase iron-sulfur subunit